MFIQKILIKIKKCKDHNGQVNQKCIFGAIFGQKSRVVEYSVNPYLKMSLALAISTSTLFSLTTDFTGRRCLQLPTETICIHRVTTLTSPLTSPFCRLWDTVGPTVAATQAWHQTQPSQYHHCRAVSRGCITSGHNQMPWPSMSSLLCIAESKKKN